MKFDSNLTFGILVPIKLKGTLMKNLREVTIAVDDREELDAIAIRLSKYPGVTVERSVLDGGDFLVAPGVIVMRKRPYNLMQSVVQKRLFEQIATLQTKYKECIILIEGNPYDHEMRMPDSAVDGALSYMSLLSGAKVINSPFSDKTTGLLWRMSLHMTHGLGYEIDVRVNKPKETDHMAKYLLQGLPMVTGETVKRLLDHFGTPLAIFNASVEELLQVKNMPEDIAKAIHKVLRN